MFVPLLLCPVLGRAADPQWTLVWNDEFNGAANTSPDSTRWTYDLGGGGWGNGELETYTNSTSNVYQDGNGHLVIEALDNGGYTSARMKSQGLFDQAYGMIEASIELPAGTTEGSGLWPAFWMLGSNINTATWPLCGEIDIMENIGQYDTNTQNGGHIHGPVEPGGGDYNGGDGVGTTYTLPAGQAMNTAFHLYAVSWTPTSITYYVDGVAYQTLTAANLPGGGEWVFNHPFFIIMNLALGGPVGGAVTCSFPQQMLVDYVRVYKLTDNGTSPYGGTAPSLPGTIQAVNYDSYDDTADPTEPGEGFAYNALNSTQTNGVYRTGDAVSTEDCSDTGGGYDYDYTSPGQWLQYSVSVAQTGSYTLDARVASDGPGGTFHVDVDGTAVTGELSCPDTGGWQTWTDVTAGGINLTAGNHVVLLVEDGMGSGDQGVCNIHTLSFTLPATPTPTATDSPSPTGTESRSPSPTKSLSPSRTASDTATPKSSPSASATPSPTRSPTTTKSASPTYTVSGTPSDSATITGTRTPSATKSPSPSHTVSATATQSLTPTPTRSSSPTKSVSPTYSVSETLTPSLSPSASPSVTLTRTAIPTRSSSPTKSVSPTYSVSQTLTPSLSPSASPTLTVSRTATPTRSPSPAKSVSPTYSVSQTATPSPSPSSTRTFTPTPSASASATLSDSPSAFPSPSLSAGPPATASATASPFASASPSPNPTSAATPTPSPTAGPSAAPTADATPASGGNGILGSCPVPDPNPVSIRVLLSGYADSVRVDIYTKALVLAGEAGLENAPAGWVSVPLPASFTGGAANGLYYYRVVSLREGSASKAVAGKLLLLR
ncbi:MAG TPA: family 16 glycosylhydrolase [bacterium]|nr:family 16 glycosylhydrolase [bacterium]